MIGVKYRPDIDGLRAVAILTVLGFHIFPEHVSGGFIGVDVFFVISGFLISSIILEGLDRGHFSIKEFYVRRVRRIFPALITVLVATVACAWFLYFEEDYKALGKHVLAAGGFFNNIQLWKESGYFDSAAITKPLLHLWSLGIEEQFYLVWPIMLWFIWRRRFDFRIIIAGLIAVSFAFNLYYLQVDKSAAFYWPHARFWELMAGAYLTKVPSINHRGARNLQAAIGALMILVGCVVLHEKSSFPGWWALLPVLGACLLINATKDAWLNRVVLSNRVIVWIGLISYPLYLWHWPIMSFAHHVEKGMPSYPARVFIVVGSFFLAWVTYRLIEHPVRFGRTFRQTTPILIAAWLGIPLFASTMVPNNFLHFIPTVNVVNHGDIGHGYYFGHIKKHFYRCKIEALRSTALRCAQSQNSEKLDIAMIGDSHVESLFIGLAEKLKDKNLIYYLREHDYFLDRETFDAFDSLLFNSGISTVIVAGWWGNRLNDHLSAKRRAKLTELAQILVRTGKKVYLVVDDVPTFLSEPRDCKYLGGPDDCRLPRHKFEEMQLTYKPFLESVADTTGKITKLEVGHYFCDGEFCHMAKDGSLLFRDKDHLNINGSRYLAEKIWREFK